MRLRSLLLLAGIAAAAACAASAPSSEFVPPRLPALPPLPPPCADAALHARALARDSAVFAPHPRVVFWPPTPVPREVYGDTLHADYRVDSVGRLDTASLVMRSMRNSAYYAKVRGYVLSLPFAPGQLEGCSVSGWGSLTFTFGGSR